MDIHAHAPTYWLTVVTLAGSVAVSAVLLAVAARRRRPSAEWIEEDRRHRLASLGRIVDGTLMDAEPATATPQTIVYTYSIAGVTYQCAQDVSRLSALVENVRLDYPVQVRYNRANPADSIVVAEGWNGLWTNLWTAPVASGARSPK